MNEVGEGAEGEPWIFTYRYEFPPPCPHHDIWVTGWHVLEARRKAVKVDGQ